MDTDTPTISVIIPTWNRAESVLLAVESALTQSCPVLEVLVCDDGSSDATREVIDGRRDPRVRFVAGPHTGHPAVPRNRGISESRGEWLAFLDSDDVWLPGKLQLQLALLRELGTRAACSNAVRVLPGLGVQGRLLDFTGPRLPFARLLRGNLVVCSSVVLHRSMLPMVTGFPVVAAVRAAEDYALWLRVASFTDFAFVAEPLVAYSDNPEASIRGVDPQVERQRTRAVFADYLRWSHPLAARALAVRRELLRRWLDEQKVRWRQTTGVSPP